MKFLAQELLPSIPAQRPVDKYDDVIRAAQSLILKVITTNKDGNLNVDELIKKMEEDILSKAPELQGNFWLRSWSREVGD